MEKRGMNMSLNEGYEETKKREKNKSNHLDLLDLVAPLLLLQREAPNRLQ